MTASTKSALMLFSTLLIGMLLGSLITGAVNNRRMRSLAEMRSARGLAIRFEDMVRPESEEQREAIRAILEEAAPEFAAVMLESRERMRSLTDSVRAELDPLLTEEQRERLDRGMRIGPRGAPGSQRPEDDRRRRRPHPEGNRDPGVPPPASHDDAPPPPPTGAGAR
jgi:galactokinase